MDRRSYVSFPAPGFPQEHEESVLPLAPIPTTTKALRCISERLDLGPIAVQTPQPFPLPGTMRRVRHFFGP